MKRNFFTLAALTAALVMTTGLARAVSPAEKKAGLALAKTEADAIVEINMVVTMQISVNGRTTPPRERKLDVNGTVVDASGLVVTSLAAIDPKLAYDAMRATLSGPAAQAEVGETEYKEVKIRRANGTEYPARVVLKDVDLGLAFIAPEATADGAKEKFEAVKLEPAAKGELLENYISLSRAAKIHQRAPIIRPTFITAVVSKPRTVYLVPDVTSGCPVFDLDGKLLGIAIQQIQAGRAGGLVILPSADIAEIAKQAQQAAQAAPVAPAPKAEVETPAAAPETK